MLRRALEGLGMLFLVVVLFGRLDVGLLLPIFTGAGVVTFTGWRIYKLWDRYHMHVTMRKQPIKQNVTVENEMLALRGQQHGRGTELTFWTGFMLGGAMVTDPPTFAGEGDLGVAGGSEIGVNIEGDFSGDM